MKDRIFYQDRIFSRTVYFQGPVIRIFVWNLIKKNSSSYFFGCIFWLENVCSSEFQRSNVLQRFYKFSCNGKKYSTYSNYPWSKETRKLGAIAWPWKSDDFVILYTTGRFSDWCLLIGWQERHHSATIVLRNENSSSFLSSPWQNLSNAQTFQIYIILALLVLLSIKTVEKKHFYHLKSIILIWRHHISTSKNSI